MALDPPRGNIVAPTAISPDTLPYLLKMDADGNLLVYLSGGSIVIPHALLDGTQNNDTVAGAPDEGDIIVGVVQGDASIKWQNLSAGDDGQVLTVQADGSVEWEDAPPGGYTQGARVNYDNSITIPNLTWTKLTFNQERYDTDNIHDNATNPTRLTCKTAGKYIITGHVSFDNNATGLRAARILLNNTNTLGHQRFMAVTTAGYNTDICVVAIYQLAVNDYVELSVMQSSGGDLNVENVADSSPEFAMQRIG